MMRFELPYPPSMNHYWRHVVMGKRSATLLSKAGRQYREDIEAALLTQSFETLSGRLAVEIRAFPPDKRRRDLDNIQKPLLDAMQYAGVYCDDSQIDALHTFRGPCKPGGMVVVTIETLEDER